MITSITIGGLTINTGSNYALTGESGLDLPPARHASFNLAGEHFGSFVSSLYGVRRFSLDILVIGTDSSDFIIRRTALLSAFDSLKGEQDIVFVTSDARSVKLSAVTIDCDFPLKAGNPASGEAHIELEAAFPFFTAEEVSVALSLPTGGGRSVPPPTMPMGLSMSSGGTSSATNNGTAPAYPIIRFGGPVTNPAIRNEMTGEELASSSPWQPASISISTCGRRRSRTPRG